MMSHQKGYMIDAWGWQRNADLILEVSMGFEKQKC